MEASNAPDVFQAKMSSLFNDLEYVRTYLDDLLILSSSTFEDHLDKLDFGICRKKNLYKCPKVNFRS